MRRQAWAVLWLLGACKNAPEANVPPVADAGFDRVVAVGATALLDGTASHDPDAAGAALSYAWEIIAIPAASTAALTGAATAQPSFVADREGTYLVWLEVTDRDGARSVPDVVQVTALRFLQIERVTPADQAMNVSRTSPLLVEFAQAVQADSVTSDTILVSTPSGAVAGTVSVDDGNRVAIFAPLSPWLASTRHSVFVGYGVRSLRGLPVAIPFESDFTTLGGADLDPPVVIEILPAGGAVDVATSASVRITFSEPVTRASAAAAFSLTGPSGVIAGSTLFSSADMRMTFTPDTLLAAAAAYTIDLAAGVADLDGNPTTAPVSQSFTTTSTADNARPSVSSVDPGPGFTDVGVQARVVVTFSEAAEPATVTATTFIVGDTAGVVAGALALSVGNTVATFTPSASLAYDSAYTVTLTTGITDRAGNALDGDGAGGAWMSGFNTVARTQDIDHFRVEAAPALLAAGEATTVSITAEDINGDAILGYQNVLPIALSQSGGAGGKTWSGACVSDNGDGTGSLVNSGACWVSGVATVSLSNTVAQGPLTLTVTEADTGLSRTGNTGTSNTNVTWAAGALDHFQVAVLDPTTRIAGEAVRIEVTAEDAFANTVDYQNTQPVTLDQDGSASGKLWDDSGSLCLGLPAGADANGDNTLADGAQCWSAGVAAFTLENTRAEGPLVIRVTENDSGNSVTGASAGITWQPGPLDHFRVEAAPVLLTAGSATTVTITAEDFHANAIAGYSNVQPNELTQNAGAAGFTWSGGCVTDNGDGTAALSNTCWAGGVASVQLANNQAEGPVRISITDPGLLRTGNTGLTGTNVTWTAGTVDHFAIEASPLSLPAGDATTVTLTAVDAFGNPIADYVPAEAIDVTVSCGGGCTGSFTFSGTSVTDTGDTAIIASTATFDAFGRFSFALADSAADIGVNIMAAEQLGGPSGATTAAVSWNSTCSAPVAVPQLVGVTDCSVQLAGSASPDGGGPPLAYTWTFLSVPTGSSVSDASLLPGAAAADPSFEADLNGDYILKLTVTNDCGSNHNDFLAVPYAMSVVAGDVIINEVVTQPRTDWNQSGGTNNNDEFVELYNRSACVRALTGWTISFVDASPSSYTFGAPLNGRILSNPNAVAYFPSAGYLVLLDPDGNANNSLANDVFITLRSDTGALIDDVELGDDPEGDGDDGAPNGGGAGGSNNSALDECVARVPNAIDTDNDIADFCRCGCTYGAANCAVCILP